MIEFNETLDRTVSGKQAIQQRMKIRVKHTTNDIPYYERGLDMAEFTYGSQVAAVKLAFRDFGPSVTVTQDGRIVNYDISVSITE